MSLDSLTTTQIIIVGANSLAPEVTAPGVVSSSTVDQLAAWLRNPASHTAINTIEATRARNAEMLNRFLQK